MRLIRKPVLCNYYVTYRCNAKCAFCDIWEKPSPYVTEQQVRENLRDLKKMGVKVIDFTGGEPLLHRELPLFLRLAKDMGFITTVTTNALLYPKYGEKMRGLVDMLHFSLDSPIREEHNASRGVDCFDHLMQSIELALKWGERPDILFTVSSDNIHQIKEVYESISLPRKLMLILNPMFEYNNIGESIHSEALDILEQWGKKKLVYINQGFIELRRNGGNKTAKPVCKAATSTVVISPENKLILPCYHLGEKEIAIAGKLFETYYSQESEEIKKLEGRLPGCEGCVINCYMQPSFAVEVNQYWFNALPSTMKYNWEKGTWKSLI
jgi:MoaA/NifB/PqqE/SkfB family radical SAM enzyme